MSEVRKIVFGRNHNEVALTVDIADENRQKLAYNMLYYMAEQGATITVRGKEMPLEKDRLWAVAERDNNSKRYTKPTLDHEWYGANKDRLENGGELLTVGSTVTEDFIMFAPVTGSYEKANEMFNFMHTGIDSAVSISYPYGDDMMHVVENGRSTPTKIMTPDGWFREEQFDHEWTKGRAPDIKYLFSGDRKYEILTDDARKVGAASYDEHYESDRSTGWSCKDRTAYRIRALRDFGDVKAGDLGGYIESENNLSHDGDCWVYDNAVVCNDAVVRDNAKVRGDAEVIAAAVISGDAKVFGEARIKDFAKVSDQARVGWVWDGIENAEGWKNGDRTVVEDCAEISGRAKVLGEVVVCDHAKIRDDAEVEGKWPVIPADKYKAYYISCVCNNAVIEGHAQVTNAYVESNAHVHEFAVVSGHPTMGGHAEIRGNAEIGGDAKILHNVTINGDAKIWGTAEIKDKVSIGHDADIRETGDYFGFKITGKPSIAFHNQEGGITIVHKGKIYNGIEEFKAAEGDRLGDKGREAIEQMENHFNDQMAMSLEEGLASLDITGEQLGQ